MLFITVIFLLLQRKFEVYFVTFSLKVRHRLVIKWPLFPIQWFFLETGKLISVSNWCMSYRCLSFSTTTFASLWRCVFGSIDNDAHVTRSNMMWHDISTSLGASARNASNHVYVSVWRDYKHTTNYTIDHILFEPIREKISWTWFALSSLLTFNS